METNAMVCFIESNNITGEFSRLQSESALSLYGHNTFRVEVVYCDSRTSVYAHSCTDAC